MLSEALGELAQQVKNLDRWRHRPPAYQIGYQSCQEDVVRLISDFIQKKKPQEGDDARNHAETT